VATRHGESKYAARHLLALADLYADLSLDYVADHPPEGLQFDPGAFRDLVDSGSRIYEMVASRDGAPEKIEAARRLEAFLALRCRSTATASRHEARADLPARAGALACATPAALPEARRSARRATARRSCPTSSTTPRPISGSRARSRSRSRRDRARRARGRRARSAPGRPADGARAGGLRGGDAVRHPGRAGLAATELLLERDEPRRRVARASLALALRRPASRSP